MNRQHPTSSAASAIPSPPVALLDLDAIVRESLRYHGAATVPQLVHRLGLETALVRRALGALAAQGVAYVDPCDRWRLVALAGAPETRRAAS